MYPALDELSRHLDGALIASDFDGTLSDLVLDPMRSRPVPGAIDALVALAGKGAQIAIVTGRDAETVVELGGLDRIPGVAVSGLHGAETWRDGRIATIEQPPGLDVLRRELPSQLRPGVWLEDKGLSLVIHTRGTDDPDAEETILAGWLPSLAGRHDLDVCPGKNVLEIRIPGLSKATGLAPLLARTTSGALYAGDDLGDLPGIAAIRDWARRHGRPGVSISVGELAETASAADLAVASPTAFVRILERLENNAR